MTPWEWQSDIKKMCDKCGVDFLSTPFDKTAVDFLDGIGIDFFKIASFELVDIPLIEYVASKHKPIIMSVGMGSVQEIQEALEACYKYDNHDVTLLKCCSQYPAKYEDLNLSVIPDMRERFHKVIGLSDHSFGSVAPVMAVAYGAKVIEKHICLSRQMESQDAGFSMEVEEFARMVKDVRNAALAVGTNTYKLTANEESGLIGRRSLVAVKEIKAGEPFTEENIRSIRPAIGIKPKYYSQLIGRNAKHSYAFGAPILIDEVE
jgi:N-acetylneuraminate synthase/pseudaminic acid synthase